MIIKVGDDKLNESDKNILHINHLIFCDCCNSEIFGIQFGLSKKRLMSRYLDEITFREYISNTVNTQSDLILDKPFIEKNVMIVNDKHICRFCWKTKTDEDDEFIDRVKSILKFIKEKKENENN